ncbi:MAG: bifunctional [glutamate--ammonia ligase]-adenylyl-L-tyrosine phosphorylase/[glutamate--ammonia-ligase] adenylyltransferase [Magnetococcales bacterium]|nr:bifunctional [glutamate--ammonia ligase]-adenylyl-L-tyrosine phosphorylase/[glutamate--ammonia-ligase] adenylyltransferase [Magnetococcales bacterium]
MFDHFFVESPDRRGLEQETEDAILALAAMTADPPAVRHHLERFVDNHPDRWPILAAWLRDPQLRRRLVLSIGNSPYLAKVLHRWPECLQATDAPPLDIAAENSQLLRKLSTVSSWNEAARLIRSHKHRCFFHIGSHDLSGESSLTTVVQAISALADGCLEAGYQWLDRTLAARYGRPMVQTETGQSEPARFVILGMGKLGARELNFSSDVDLIYLFDAAVGEVEGCCTLSIKEYYNRLGRDFIRLLGESTAEGQAFRVDLRLRPEGESGDLAISCRSAELYYESWGQTWERAAMIKARPVAGNLAQGEKFLAWLRPFIYRRYLDFPALEAIREMKRKIDQKMARAEDYHRNVKLGYGGIREIEFFVQSQQLIYGGKNGSVRHRETLVTLEALCAAGLLAEETSRFLAQAYQFLRTLEHRLQLKHDQQMHSVPEDPEAFERLSKRMGMREGTELQARLTATTQGVHAIYEALFFEAEKQWQSSCQPEIEALLACEPGEPHALALLQKAGFNDPEQSVVLMGILRDGPRRDMTEVTRRWYRRIAAPLLQEILQAPDQDMAIRHAETFLTSLGHRVSYLALLLENPPVLSLLVRLFGTSVLLSQFFMKHPELMDRLVDRDFCQHYRNRGALATDLADRLADVAEQEERFNLIREFKNSETLRMGIRDLSKTAESPEVMAGLSALADVILARVLEDAQQELQKRYGDPQAPFLILAMGKLGGRELNYASDLDLIFLHGEPAESREEEKNKISHTLYFTRLGQRIITGITTLTRAGKLYELDMRLRPSGNSGTLVTSVTAFLNYQRTEAWTWEHQALTRARVVVGDPVLSSQLQQEIRAIIQQPRDLEKLRTEVREMRQRMFEDKKPGEGWIDIKQSRGGIVDIEFLTQLLILACSARHPDIVQNNTARGLYACQQAGLLSMADYTLLEEAYGFYRLLENRLRLLHGRSENRIGPSPVVREQLRRLCDLPTEKEVVTVLMDYFNAVYPIIRAYFDGSSPLLPSSPPVRA